MSGGSGGYGLDEGEVGGTGVVRNIGTEVVYFSEEFVDIVFYCFVSGGRLPVACIVESRIEGLVLEVVCLVCKK